MLISTVATPVCTPTENEHGFLFPTLSPAFVICFLDDSQPSQGKRHSKASLTLGFSGD